MSNDPDGADGASSASQSQGALGFDVKITGALAELARGRSSGRLQRYFNADPEYLVSRVNLMQVVDSEGFSLLHIAVFKKYSGDVERVLLNQIKETCKDKEKIRRYLGLKTKNEDGHTALHLAAFHGNFSAIKFLIEEGADP